MPTEAFDNSFDGQTLPSSTFAVWQVFFIQDSGNSTCGDEVMKVFNLD
jgi:hypothetical protein